MDRETRPGRAPRKGTAVSRYESAVVANETNHWWFIEHLHETGWSDEAIATHFALSAERVRKIVAAAFPGAPYLARGRNG